MARRLTYQVPTIIIFKSKFVWQGISETILNLVKVGFTGLFPVDVSCSPLVPPMNGSEQHVRVKFNMSRKTLGASTNDREKQFAGVRVEVDSSGTCQKPV